MLISFCLLLLFTDSHTLDQLRTAGGGYIECDVSEGEDAEVVENRWNVVIQREKSFACFPFLFLYLVLLFNFVI